MSGKPTVYVTRIGDMWFVSFEEEVAFYTRDEDQAAILGKRLGRILGLYVITRPDGESQVLHAIH